MGKRDFDNIAHHISVAPLVNGGALVSTEVDLELPRGFIAKIYEIIMTWVDLHEDLDEHALDFDVGLNGVLLRDPDDALTQNPPTNEVQNDILASMQFWYYSGTNNAAELGAAVSHTIKHVKIPEHVDMITARNLRWNFAGVGGNSGDLTESAGRVEIYYTLEKVTDADILELLDIL